MDYSQIACPACRTLLRTKPLPAGTLIKCPQCSATFPVTAPRPAAPLAMAITARPSSVAVPSAIPLASAPGAYPANGASVPMATPIGGKGSWLPGRLKKIGRASCRERV